ncbi:MAG: pyruvate kinase alpha/beta domain-containing protein [Chloroflexota bacterium]
METKVTYFEKPGPANTETTLRLARERADELGIRQVIVASTRGDTALKAMDVFAGFKVVVVGIVIGPREHDTGQADFRPFSPEARQAVTAKGGVVLNTTHAFGGLNRALRNQLDWKANPISLIAAALRVFGSGMKVACEVAMMAADSGLVDTAEDAVVVAGSGRGADTAVVLRPVNAHRFFDLKVKEIICKPLS